MEDIEGYLAHSTVSIQGRKKTMDTTYESAILKNEAKKGVNGETTGMFALYAGFGGPTVAQWMKTNFVGNIKKNADYNQDLERAIVEEAGRARTGIQEMWRVQPVKHCASVCLVAIRDGHVYCFNAGQTRAILCRAEGEKELLTEPTARISESAMVPNVNVVGLDWEDEFILIGCNGLFSRMTEDQAIKMARVTLRKYKDPKYTAQKLTYASYVNGSSANISAMIIIINPSTALGDLSGKAVKLLLRRDNSETSSNGSGNSGISNLTSPSGNRPAAVFIGGARRETRGPKKSGQGTTTSNPESREDSRSSSRGLASPATPTRHFDWDVATMKAELSKLSAAMEFEKAAELRDKITLVEHMNDLVRAMEYEAAAKIRDQLKRMG